MNIVKKYWRSRQNRMDLKELKEIHALLSKKTQKLIKRKSIMNVNEEKHVQRIKEVQSTISEHKYFKTFSEKRKTEMANMDINNLKDVESFINTLFNIYQDEKTKNTNILTYPIFSITILETAVILIFSTGIINFMENGLM